MKPDMKLSMSNYHFCIGCQYIMFRRVTGLHGTPVQELSCPTRFNPLEREWMLEMVKNPHQYPRNDNYFQILKQGNGRRPR
jgi:hypothetical protein